ncbi:MAG: hypothetical protein AAFR60_10560, partial [Pseudomonadota bacterium]
MGYPTVSQSGSGHLRLRGFGSIGNATIGRSSKTEPLISGVDHEAIGFYALEYDWNGQTVIGYRGTDDDRAHGPASDVANGYGIGAGGEPPPMEDRRIEIEGGDGDDVLIGSEYGRSILHGGAGNDHLVYHRGYNGWLGTSMRKNPSKTFTYELRKLTILLATLFIAAVSPLRVSANDKSEILTFQFQN